MSEPAPAHPADPIVGIDLGTTNSLVAVAFWGDDPAPRTLEDPRPGHSAGSLLPSVVHLPDSPGATPLIGEPARALAARFPLTTIHSVKRLMGRSLADVQRSGDLTYLGYSVVAPDPDRPEHGQCLAAVPGGRTVTPQELSALILRELRERASAALGVPVSRAVITVPAYFDDAQRQATRDAGRLAGLDVLRILNEPTAAALGYGLGLRESVAAAAHQSPRAPRTVVVFDLGGGTFDVSILRLTPAGHDGLDHQTDVFQVLATAGDTHLGGDDMNHALASLFLRELDLAHTSPHDRQALLHAAEQCKIRLSADDSAAVRLTLPADDVRPNPRAYERTVTRAEFETLISPLVDRALAAVRRALRDARRALADDPIDAVILVGGATRVPLIRRRVAETFGLSPYTALDPDRVVALGAAVQAAVLAASAPAHARTHPQAAAAAAALLLDVLPLSLGIETAGGAVAKLIVRNTAVPARATERFSTSVDNQTAITLHVLQGEREMAADCRSLGVFHLRGLPPMPAGIPRLVVEFFVDASGILSVSAVEERSGVRAQLQVVPNHGLSPEQVERMEAESLAHARDDMTRHRVVDLLANSKLALHWTQRQLDRVGATLPDALQAGLRARMEALRAFITAADHDWRTVDPNAFHAAKEGLEHASIPLHEAAIAHSLRGGTATPPAPTAPGQQSA